jgi:hypothetical protein
VKPTLHNDKLFPEPRRRGKGRVKTQVQPAPEPEPIPETEAERNRRLWFSGEMRDSLGNVCRDARDKDGVLIQRLHEKVSLLGPDPEIPKPAPIADASNTGPSASRQLQYDGSRVMDAAYWHDKRNKR